jgi:hypothetical protein
LHTLYYEVNESGQFDHYSFCSEKSAAIKLASARMAEAIILYFQYKSIGWLYGRATIPLYDFHDAMLLLGIDF